MKFKKKIMTYCMLVLFFLVCVSYSGYAQQSSEQPKGGSSGSSDPVMSSQQINSDIVKGQQDIAQSNNSLKKPVSRNVRKHPLAPPTNFIRDGVYVWCDPDGLWTIFLKNKKQRSISIRLFSQSPIELSKHSKNIEMKEPMVNPNNILIECKQDKNVSIVQFLSDVSTCDFEIMFDNEYDPNSVYYGHLLERPNKETCGLPDHYRSHYKTMLNSNFSHEYADSTMGPEISSPLKTSKDCCELTPGGSFKAMGKGGKKADEKQGLTHEKN